MLKVYTDPKSNQSKPWRKIHQGLLSRKPDLCLRNYQSHKPLEHNRMYQRSVGVHLPCSYAAASYTPAVGWCQVMELDGPQRPVRAFLLFCRGLAPVCATGPGVDQAARVVQASRGLWARGLLKGVGASFSLPGEPRLGGLQMASWGSDCTPTGSAEFPKKKLKENRTLCKGKAAYICIVIS